jgi:alanyl-tRNA synthetase
MIRVDGASEFKGYDHLELNGKVTALFIDGKAVDSVSAGQEAVVILDQTPFYAESGGQVGDKGELKGAASPSPSATRRNTARPLVISVNSPAVR